MVIVLLGAEEADRAVLKVQDVIAYVEHGGPMGDGHNGHIWGTIGESSEYSLLSIGIECARRLIENEQARFPG